MSALKRTLTVGALAAAVIALVASGSVALLLGDQLRQHQP